jgi:hypothetical protein
MGVDPGLHTGVCLFDSAKTLVDNVAEVSSRTWQFLGSGWFEEAKMANEIAKLVFLHDVEVLVIEDFILQPGGTGERSGLSPVRVTAMLDSVLAGILGEKYSSRACVIEGGGVMRKSYSAGFAKSTWSDERLRRAGLWGGLTAHERDAWRHALSAAKSAGMLKRV